MDLNLVLCVGIGVLVIAVILYLFRNVLAIIFGPALGIVLYNRCQSLHRGQDHALIALYLSAIRRFIEAIGRAVQCLLPLHPSSTQHHQQEGEFYNPSDKDVEYM